MKYTIETEDSEEIVIVNREAYNDLIKENESLLQRQENLNNFFEDKLRKSVINSFIDSCTEDTLDKLVIETNPRELVIKVTESSAITTLSEMYHILPRTDADRIVKKLALSIKERILSRVMLENKPKDTKAEAKESKEKKEGK